ncbi:MAG TPA: carbamoyltransferase C-terminal domain-containing protein [Stellaceae bacterium]|nr:carbamoyltransferase C-terminal domain-containing protein [Stellaceae bacterium]
MVYILGLNAYHGDSSACLVRDGKLVAAIEEERFRRIKHWAGFPEEAIKYCLAEAGIGLAEVDHVAVNRDPWRNMWRKALFSLRQRPDIRYIFDRLGHARRWASVGDEFARRFPGAGFRAQLWQVEHHLAHLASAFYVSPFPEAVVVSVDGSGDFASAAWGLGTGSDIRIDGRVPFPHSLGIFYEAMTQYLGFPYYGDEYKVMGLAPYGEPKYVDELLQIVDLRRDGSFRLNLDYFSHHRERRQFQWADCAPSSGRLATPALAELLGPERRPDQPLEQRHKDIARSIQRVYEEAFFNLLNRLYERYQQPHLALAGGCAFNSVANGKIYDRTPFRRCYIQSAAGDAGGAVGAAFHAWHAQGAQRSSFVMDHAYWGPHFADAEIEAALRARLEREADRSITLSAVADEDAYCREVAAAIAAGKVVGWFQGRVEWGPRALGSRSILCDPRRTDMKDILNLKIKRRESFRPFAPSVLREAVRDWFETDDDVPFMMKVFQIRPERRGQIPAVTHVDGSGRLQTVKRAANPRYYRLIECFRDLTGVPIVLNTSFNENEPIVCRPEEAIDCFLRTRMDLLAIGGFLLRRQEEGALLEPGAGERHRRSTDA